MNMNGAECGMKVDESVPVLSISRQLELLVKYCDTKYIFETVIRSKNALFNLHNSVEINI